MTNKRNPIARDLRTPKYAPRVVSDKRDRELRRELLNQAREAQAEETDHG